MSNPTRPCEFCDNGICAECDGEGFVECTCPTCDHSHETDCDTCGATGRCGFCGGTGIREQTTAELERDGQLALRPIVGDAYDSPQPIASPHADPVTLEAGSVPPGFLRAQKQRKEKL